MRGTGLGLASVILAAFAIFLPMGFMVSGISGVLAICVYKYRDSYALCALILNIANLTFLSPVTFTAVMSSMSDKHINHIVKIDSGAIALYWLIFLAQVVGIYLNFKSKENRQPKKKSIRIEPKL